MTLWIDYASRIENKFNPSKSALLIVDVQFGFCSPEGQTGRKHANTKMQRLPDKINEFVDYFKSLGGLPIYFKSVPDDNHSSKTEKWLNNLKDHQRPATENDPELALYGLDIDNDGIIIEKTGDGFSQSNLKFILDANNIETVLVCGVRTEICVRRIAERATTEDYLVFVLKDLCATRDDNADHEEQALLFLNAYTGIVLDTAKIKELFEHD